MGGKIEGNLVYGILYTSGKDSGRKFLLQNVPGNGVLGNWGFIYDIYDGGNPGNTIREKVVVETGYELTPWISLGNFRDTSASGGRRRDLYILAAVLDEVSSERLEKLPCFRCDFLHDVVGGKNISPDSRYIAQHFGWRL